MYLHLTFGTEDFLLKVKEKNITQEITLASSVQKSILFYISEKKKSIFQMPQTFKIINQNTRNNTKKLVSLHRFHLDKETAANIEFHVKSCYLEITKKYQLADALLVVELKNKSIMMLLFWSDELTYKLFLGSESYEQMMRVKKHYQLKDEAFFTPYIEQSYIIVE